MKGLLFFVFIILLSGIVIAEPSFIFKQSEVANIRISCFDENSSACISTVVCGITIIHPNTSLVINNGTMTFNGTTYNYSLTSGQTVSVGVFTSVVICDGATDGFSTFTFLITPNGENPSTALGILYIGLFAIIVMFFIFSIIGTFKAENPFYKASGLGISYLFLISIIFISWNIASNFLTASPFLIDMLFIIFRVSMILLLPFIMSLIIWSIFEFRKVNVIKTLIEKGVPEAEAIHRAGGKKW